MVSSNVRAFVVLLNIPDAEKNTPVWDFIVNIKSLSELRKMFEVI
jgi:hypothetical protein